FDCSSEYLAETEIRLLLQSLKIGNDVIEGYIEQSREIVDRIEISVGKNFKVL
ncbi:TetR/AcrR family transcriptional regulator, partial [[Clostridium] scindens]|nr:TetR/AcrR family transcriptional regulator [[Clostridium] scindens]